MTASSDRKFESRPVNEAQETPAQPDCEPARPTEGSQPVTLDDPASLRAELEKANAEREGLLERLARVQAEFDNARKRALREQQEFKDVAVAEALKVLLPALDSLDWALQAPAQDLQEFRGGVDLIRRQLHDALSKLGLRPVPARGEPFDPHIHEAVEVVETTTAKDNEVLEELQRGYKFKDQLLRPAMVLVARNLNSVTSS